MHHTRKFDRGANAGLYVHVPFCRSKCPYCDFYSVTDLSAVQEWYEAVLAEMTFHGDFASAFDTVYIGGGTPSCLPAGLLPDLLRRIRSALPVSADAEITVEVNPGDVDLDTLVGLREAGFNRVSIGVQSFDDGILSFLGRRHGGRGALHAIDAARRAGFTNLSMDLIYGVPGQSRQLWRRTLETALTFEPEHLSCYELTLERGTPLHRRVEAGQAPALPAEEEAYRFFSATSIFLEAHGYLHYEVSNFARGETRISRHNHKYWDHAPYLGLGPAAHSFRTDRRWWNHRSVDLYMRDIRQGRIPVAGQEELSQEELQTEALYFGFRTRRGIHGPSFRERYGLDVFRQKGAALRRMRADGLIRLEGETLAPTRRGLAVADRLCLL